MQLPLLSIRRWQVAGPLAFVLAFLAAFLAARPEHADSFGPAGMLAGYAAAGSIMWARSVDLAPRERRAWRLMAVGCLMVAVGVLVTAVLVLTGQPIPAFGPTDVFFILTYTALVSSIVMLARAEAVGRDWVVTILDALIAGIALVGLVWLNLRSELIDIFKATPGRELMVAITYPIIDIIAVIALLIMVLRRSNFRLDPRMVFVACTLGFQFLADVHYLKGGLGNTFQATEPAYPLLLLSAAGALLAAAIVDRTPMLREYPERSTPLLLILWPYLLVVALVVNHIVTYAEITGGRSFALDSLLVIMILGLVRQLIVVAGQRRLVDTQRSELVASVSHELRTPLTAIVGYLTLLDQEGDHLPDDVRKEMLADATEQSRHMARLVADLMLLARGSDRRVPLEVKDTTVSQLVREALAEVPEIEVTTEIADDSVIKVDRDRMRQALANMLTNAHKYGGGRILLRASVRHERTLVIEVHDNGPGVPTKYERTIWERFERGAKRLDSTTPGMGIGLAILRAVAESHGGTAAYRRSELLGGACFTVRVPGCVVARPVRLGQAQRLRPTVARRPDR